MLLEAFCLGDWKVCAAFFCFFNLVWFSFLGGKRRQSPRKVCFYDNAVSVLRDLTYLTAWLSTCPLVIHMILTDLLKLPKMVIANCHILWVWWQRCFVKQACLDAAGQAGSGMHHSFNAANATRNTTTAHHGSLTGHPMNASSSAAASNSSSLRSGTSGVSHTSGLSVLANATNIMRAGGLLGAANVTNATAGFGLGSTSLPGSGTRDQRTSDSFGAVGTGEELTPAQIAQLDDEEYEEYLQSRSNRASTTVAASHGGECAVLCCAVLCWQCVSLCPVYLHCASPSCAVPRAVLCCALGCCSVKLLCCAVLADRLN